jgi:fatty acid desaturase
MASSTSIEITPSTTVIQKEVHADYSALLLLPLTAVVAHQYSKKQMRKLGRKMMWQLLKVKMKSMFSFKGKKKKSLLFKIFLIAILVGVAFGVIFSFAAGVFAFVLSLVAAVIVLFIKSDRG